MCILYRVYILCVRMSVVTWELIPLVIFHVSHDG